MPERPPPVTGGREFRPEIQALRALAVGAVILFHLWPDRLTGGYVGVDVFFVISGFLITAHLVKEIDATGRLDLARFWARRVRRLLPAAVVVLIVTLIATLLIVPAVAWQRVVTEIAAAGAYVLNWLLASGAVDYFAADSPATPVQHYWSLSVEEQFYLLWPLLLLGLAVLRPRGAARRALAVGIGAVFVVSLAVSIIWAAVSPESGYFSTFTHAWEFALGGALALAQPALSRAGFADRPALRAALSWIGFAMIGVSVVTFTGDLPFPGAIALLPVVGTAAVIAAGTDRRVRWSPAIVTRLPPVQWMGDVSYSAYLWHWPPIVLLPIALGTPLGVAHKVVILVATFGLAALSKSFIEDPFRRSRRFALRTRRAFAFAAVAALTIATACTAPWVIAQQRIAESVAYANELVDGILDQSLPCVGAGAALTPSCADNHLLDPQLVYDTSAAPPSTPEAIDLAGGLSAIPYGDPSAATTIALVGDSHARHYLPSLLPLAERNDWRILLLWSPSCTPSAPTWESSYSDDQSEGCQTFRSAIFDHLGEVPGIDLVITSSVAPRYSDEPAEVQASAAAAFTEMWDAWLAAGIPVIVVADVPGPGAAVGQGPACIAAHVDEVDPCTALRRDVLDRDAMVVAATESPRAGLHLVDFSDVYCGPEVCHAVVGGVGVYADGAHLSRTFALSLAPHLEPVILASLSASGSSTP